MFVGQKLNFAGLALLLLSGCVAVGAIKCYQCQSHSQDGCFPLDKSIFIPTECPSEAVKCTFLRQEADFTMEINGKRETTIRYDRGCSSLKPESPYYCIDRTGTGGITKNRYCSCTTDGCNSAGSLTMSIILLIAPMAAYLMSTQ